MSALRVLEKHIEDSPGRGAKVALVVFLGGATLPVDVLEAI